MQIRHSSTVLPRGIGTKFDPILNLLGQSSYIFVKTSAAQEPKDKPASRLRQACIEPALEMISGVAPCPDRKWCDSKPDDAK
jgi:hypothetical protein